MTNVQDEYRVPQRPVAFKPGSRRQGSMSDPFYEPPHVQAAPESDHETDARRSVIARGERARNNQSTQEVKWSSWKTVDTFTSRRSASDMQMDPEPKAKQQEEQIRTPGSMREEHASSKRFENGRQMDPSPPKAPVAEVAAKKASMRHMEPPRTGSTRSHGNSKTAVNESRHHHASNKTIRSHVVNKTTVCTGHEVTITRSNGARVKGTVVDDVHDGHVTVQFKGDGKNLRKHFLPTSPNIQAEEGRNSNCQKMESEEEKDPGCTREESAEESEEEGEDSESGTEVDPGVPKAMDPRPVVQPRRQVQGTSHPR